jgi:tetratricopeptide (TPR) repeat protein
MRSIFPVAFLGAFLAACSGKKNIIHPHQYRSFLSDEKRIEKEVGKIKDEIRFWQQRLFRDTGSYVDQAKLAALYSLRFRLSHHIQDLHTADSLYRRSASKAKVHEPEILLAAAQNAMAMHRFTEAWKLLNEAEKLGANPYLLRLVKFDAAMELGYIQQAGLYLDELKVKNDFDYLIRKARLEDYKGQQDEALRRMEQALKQARSSGRKHLMAWTMANLADMYGHAGKIRKAYKYYLETLKTDSSHLQALRGIAWIAFSHEQNTAEAKRILHYILSQSPDPEILLLLADIAEWEGRGDEKKKYTEMFIAKAENAAWGDMYNKQRIRLYLEQYNKPEKAMALAEKEVMMRPTPQTYSWMALALLQYGESPKAHRLINDFVLGKTGEPETLLHAARVLQATGMKEEAKKLYQKTLSSAFELGPLETINIRKNIRAL